LSKGLEQQDFSKQYHKRSIRKVFYDSST